MTASCARRAYIRSEEPGTLVVGEHTEIVGEEPVPFVVAPGPSAVPMRLRTKSREYRGQLARTEVSPWQMSAVAAATTVCVPTAAVAALCAVNPAAWVALAGCAQSGPVLIDFALLAPSDATVPALGFGAAVGFLPLLWAYYLPQVPGEIALRVEDDALAY